MGLMMRIAVLGCLVAMVSAAEYSILWKVALDNKTLTVGCGDKIKLAWGKNFTHNVYKSSTGNCNDTSTKLAEEVMGGSYNYTITNKDAGKFYFICKYGQHCQNGQKLEITSKCSAASFLQLGTTSTILTVLLAAVAGVWLM